MSSSPSSPSLHRSKAQSNVVSQGSPTTSPMRDMRSQVLASSGSSGSNNNAAALSTSPSADGGAASPSSRQTRSNSFFRKPSIRTMLTGSGGAALAAAAGVGGGEREMVPAADMSTPEALIAALQQVRLTAENLIRLGTYPKSLTLMWLTEFTTRGGLRALLEYMADYKRNTIDVEMRLLILRQCTLFLSAYLKREDDEPEGVLCLTLDAADEVWSVLDERPALLRQFITYLRTTSGDSSNTRLMLDFRVAVLAILTQLVARVRDQPAAERKFGTLLNAGLYPTLLWLRRRWRTHDAIFTATLVLEHALFDAYELAIGRAFKPSSNGGTAAAAAPAASGGATSSTSTAPSQRVPHLVALDPPPLDTATAPPTTTTTTAPAKSEEGRRTKRRTKTVRVQLSAASHVGYFSVPYSSSATVDSIKRAALRMGSVLLNAERTTKGGAAASSSTTTTTTVSSSSSASDEDVTDAMAARYLLSVTASGNPLDDDAKLGDVGVEVDAMLYLRGKPSVVRVVSIIHGKQEQLDLTYDALDFETVASVRARCAQSISHPLAEQCRIYVPSGAAPHTMYETSESNRSLGSLPEGVPLQFKLPPRQLKVAFKDGTFAFVSVSEAMPVAQLLTQLAKKRSISTTRLQDYGVFVDDESATGGGYWVVDDATDKKRTVTHLYEHADEVTVRFVPRAHPVRLTLELGDSDGPLRRGRVIDLFFDSPVSQSIVAVCDSLSLKQSPLELVLMHKKKKAKAKAALSADPVSTTDDSTDVGSSRDPSTETPRELEEELLLGWVPLRAQGVNQNDSLVLRLRTNTSAADNRVDIWKEEETAETVQYSEEVDRALNVRPIVAATLNRLVAYLTSDSAHDIGFANTFMYAHRTIAPPEAIIGKFVERFRVPAMHDENATFIVQMRVCIALKRFIEMYVECAGDPQKAPLEAVRQFVETTVSKTRQCERIAPILLRQVDQALVRVEEARALFQKLVEEDEAAAAAEPTDGGATDGRRMQRMMSNRLGMSFTSLSIEEMARCITTDDYALFEKIEPREYFDAAWTRKRRALAPNLRAFIDRFNQLSAWVSSSIVSVPLLRDRVRVFERFVQLMTALLELQNFSALMAIISGLNNSSVLRLKGTKSKLAKRTVQQLAQYEEMMNMEGSFQRYRRAIKRCAPPVVPYVGVALMDLTFIEEGNPDNIGTLINFAKRRLIVDVVMQLEAHSHAYEFAVSKEIQFYFRNLPLLTDKACYELSLEIEPRGVDVKELK